MKKAMIAMSGGVDSSVAAYLCASMGYDCSGTILRLLKSTDSHKLQRIEQDIHDAKSVADRLGFPFYVSDMTKDFTEKIIHRFAVSYENGLTPNPCIDCNRFIKFGLLLDKALELDFDYLVTGHYAKIFQDPESGRFLLQKAAHREKDQSYFLYGLTQNQLSHTRFPLGDLTKEEVRKIAQNHGFINAHKRDSQDICFIPDGDYLSFLERCRRGKYPSGNFLDMDGHVVGQHNGAAGYTLGQRKGLGLSMGKPVYVIGKDMKKNTVTIGSDQYLFAKGLLAGDWNWFPFPTLTSPVRILAKTRSRQIEQSATVYPESGGICRVMFDQPQRAITAGQAVVLYDGDTVVGGGTILEAIK